MTARFAVFTTRGFDRESGKLSSAHPDFDERLSFAIKALSHDPFNTSRLYPIKKLIHVPSGEGQYRLRSGRFRFRYDVESNTRAVYLKTCGLRREDTY